MIPLPYRLLGILAFVLGVFGSGYFYGRHAQGVKDEIKISAERLTWTQAVAEGQKAATDATQANDALKTKLEVQHAQANDALNVLLSKPASRVQLPSCLPTTANSEAHASSGSPISATGPERTLNTAQEAFDRFRSSLEADAAEWSRALNACSTVMGWARAQQP